MQRSIEWIPLSLHMDMAADFNAPRIVRRPGGAETSWVESVDDVRIEDWRGDWGAPIETRADFQGGGGESKWSFDAPEGWPACILVQDGTSVIT
jgi:hypothetical protein